MKRRIFKRGLTNAKLGSNLSLAIKNEKKLAGKRLQEARRRSKTLRCSQYGIETVNGSNFWRSPENPGAEGANTQRVESLRQKDGRCPKNQAIVFGSAVQHADGGALWFFPMAFFL